MNVAKVFLDTNILKFSATALPRWRPRKQSVDWGGKTIEATVHDYVEVNPNERIMNNPTLKAEAERLPRLADIGKLGKLDFVMSSETMIESWGLGGNMDSKTGRFYGAPIKIVKPPFEYAYTLAGGGDGLDPKKRQFRFLASVRHERFLELQRMTGAYQGEQKLSRNQLLDAFYIWCAEHNDCEFLLTLDSKLIKVLSLSPAKSKVRVVLPSELLAWLEKPDREAHA